MIQKPVQGACLLLPVTENEIEKVINKLKGKFSAGFDEIPEFLVKRCTHHIKKTPNPYM